MALINCKECGAQVSNKADKCPSCGVKIKKPTSIVTWILAGIVGLGFIGVLAGGGNSDGGSSAASISPKEQALRDLEFSFDWSKGGFDSIMMIDMTIKNNGTKDIKDFKVECEHSSNSGTKIDSNNRVVYEVIKAGETKKFKEFNMGFIHSQAKSSSCGITNLVVM